MSPKQGKALFLCCPLGTSLQDEGRTLGAHYGIPRSGAMDLYSYQWANHLLQNSNEAAALEMAQPGLKIKFEEPCIVSLAGATAFVTVNQTPILNASIISIASGDILEIGAFRGGARLYLCIEGGFQDEKYLGSRSDFKSITTSSKRSAGETLYYLPIQNKAVLWVKPKWSTNWFESKEIQAYPGPDWRLLSTGQQRLLLKQLFHLSKFSNRMGIQLEELVANELEDLPTNPVFPGTVQLTPGGKIIVLMRDAGVTGGYPRILQLTEESQSRLAQKKAGDSITFHLLEPKFES
ncbi:MAG: biotin-dependent carboxyltransferase family protein [Bacteroidetes bacterium]|nr:biotin-dependent carboxyltransferase family protein [Bacteroidota bacterium]MDA1268651.1 biotin-dependent carboxyltransferase family protein [Bacteroidota bacterium]